MSGVTHLPGAIQGGDSASSFKSKRAVSQRKASEPADGAKPGPFGTGDHAPHRGSPMTLSARAFTLIELLVVIAIIASADKTGCPPEGIDLICACSVRE